MKKQWFFFYLTIYYAVHALHQEGTHSLYNFVTDNFKEYDLDTEYCLKIDKYLVCEGRDMMSGGSGAFIILLKLKTILKWRL